jgi:hypothetical protein
MKEILKEILNYLNSLAQLSTMETKWILERNSKLHGMILNIEISESKKIFEKNRLEIERVNLHYEKLEKCFIRLGILARELDKSVTYPDHPDLSSGNEESTDEFIKIIKGELNDH